MDDSFGADFITLTDEDGNEFELEYLDTLEYRGQTYMAFFPTLSEEDDEDSEEYGLIILRCVPDESGEDLLETIDDEEELEAVFQRFDEILFEEDDEGADTEDD